MTQPALEAGGTAAPFFEESVAILTRTPAVLAALLRGLPDAWVHAIDGPGTWSPYNVIGHLNHCERTDWMTRLVIVLEHGPSRPFDSVDREAQFRDDQQQSIDELLDEFQQLRAANLERLRSFQLTAEHLDKQGTHPAFGLVTLRQLLATWTAHDMAHLLQISRTMARRYKPEVGPWAEYLSVMK